MATAAPTLSTARFGFCVRRQTCGSRACPRCRRCGWSGKPRGYHREQARSHTLHCKVWILCATQNLWEPGLPAIQALRMVSQTALIPSRAGSLPHIPLQGLDSVCDAKPVGAGLARDAGAAVGRVKRADAIASKPAPTLISGTKKLGGGSADVVGLARLQAFYAFGVGQGHIGARYGLEAAKVRGIFTHRLFQHRRAH